MKRLLYTFFVILSLLVIIGCGNNNPTEVKPNQNNQNNQNIDPDKKKTVVMVLGGLGASQITFLATKISDDLPEVDVVTFGSWDSYKADIDKFCKENEYDNYILIGHSYGGDSCLNGTINVKAIDLCILLDPVARSGYHLTVGSNIYKTAIWYRSQLFGPKTAEIAGDNITSLIINDSHNSLPNDPLLVEPIEKLIKEVE
jgi:pimeloyl-ACP methyl ester carboxylesterase